MSKETCANDPGRWGVKRRDVQREVRRLRQRHAVVFFCGLLNVAITTLANFKGIDALNGVVGDMSLSTTVLAAIIAMTLGACVWVAWWLAAGVYPLARSPAHRRRGIVQIVVTLLFVALSSTVLNLNALVGGPSAVLEMREDVRALAEAGDAPIVASQNAEAVLQSLEVQAAGTCSCAELEGRRGSGGCATTRPGPGLVAANAAALCEVMRTGAESFRALVSEADARPAAYADILARLDETLRDNSLSVAARREAYIEHAALYRNALRDGVATGLDGRIRAIANSVLATVAAPPVAPDTPFGREQTQALEMFRTQAEDFAAGLVSFTEDDAARGVVPELPDPPTPIEAIFAQIENTFPLIAVAIAIDFSMFFFVGWLGLNQAAIDHLQASAPQGSHDVYLTVPSSVSDELLDQAGFVRVQWPDGKSRRFGRPRRRSLFSWLNRKREDA